MPRPSIAKQLCLLIPFQFIFGLIYIWGSLAPVIQHQSAWPNATMDLAFALTPLCLLPAVIYGARLVQRFSAKPILAAALLCFSCGSALALINDSPRLFILGYSCLALGIGAGLSTPACVALLAQYAPGHRGKLGGAMLAIYGLSAVVSAPLFQLLSHYTTWRAALGWLLAGYALIGWCCWLTLDPRPAQPPSTPHTPLALRVLLRQPQVIQSAALLLLSTPFGALCFAVIGRLALQHGFSHANRVWVVAAMALCNGMGRLLGGALCDWLSPIIIRGLILATGALAYLVLLASNQPQWVGLFWIFPLLSGGFYGALAGKLPALAAQPLPEHAHQVFGIYFSLFALGSFAGPWLSALLGLTRALTLLGGSACMALLVAILCHFYCSIHIIPARHQKPHTDRPARGRMARATKPGPPD